MKLEGAATSYHEVSSARVTLGAIHLPADVFERIGGRVIDTDVPPAPVTGASVRLVERNLVGETDDAGRFMFGNLERGTYHLSVSAPGFDPAQVPVQVPATKFNEYEVALTPH